MRSTKRFNRYKQRQNKDARVKQPDKAMQRDLDADKREHVKEAREQADADIANDADLSIHSPNDDLDEGESARLGEDVTDII
jgi:hypothetical protein